MFASYARSVQPNKLQALLMMRMTTSNFGNESEITSPPLRIFAKKAHRSLNFPNPVIVEGKLRN